MSSRQRRKSGRGYHGWIVVAVNPCAAMMRFTSGRTASPESIRALTRWPCASTSDAWMTRAMVFLRDGEPSLKHARASLLKTQVA
ncbi:hypothetical protein ACN28S_42150 [Cystobacter fuscus]